MKWVSMWSDVLQSLWQKPVTQQYPFERTDPPDRFRGRLHWNPEQCTGCQLCVKDCPAEAIELIALNKADTEDKADKQFVLRYFVDRCTFCGQCVESCRFGCLTLAHNEWELASQTKDQFTLYYGKDSNVATVVAGSPERITSPHP